MKSFKTYISEAVATRKKPTRAEKNEFADKFDQVVYSKPFTDLQDKRYLHKWHITGHNPGTKHGTNKAIEAVKEKVFGKRRKGTSDLLWMHRKHGLVTHPAIGDVTHMDVQHKPRKGIKVNKKINAKFTETQADDILGRGRIEHHEGGGGIISYTHGSQGPRAAAVRTIARKYPKYKIHDGFGNLLESETDEVSEAVATRRKKPTRAERIDFRNKMMDVRYSDAFDKGERKKGMHMWHLTGHNPKGKYGSTREIEATKERVFGKRRKGTSDLLWMHQKHGLVTHPAFGDVTHSDIDHRFGDGVRKGIKVDKKIQVKVKEGGIGALAGHGRIEHHEGGGGLISYHHAGGMPKEAAIRTIARAYPKYKIHDGYGNLLENWSEKYKRSIDCSNPKGFSQRAHCQGRKKTNEKVEVKSFMRYISEAKEETITDFVRFAARQLGLQQEPNIEFVDVRDGSMTTAAYSPSDCSMKIYRGNRATFDICRSIAHEMVHQMQDENGDELDGTTGSPCEDEANAVAGRLIRMYGAENDSFYEE